MTQPLLAGICVKKNRLRMQGNKVYLKDKQEFEIELFNPSSKNRLAKIFLNGQEISNSGLVIRPGQRLYLERYLNEAKKFRFDTYTIDGSPESLKAAASNGNVEIYFYDELVKLPDPILPDLSITRGGDHDWAEGYDFDVPSADMLEDHDGSVTMACYGGTGMSASTPGDILYASGSGTVTSACNSLAIGATGTVLTSGSLSLGGTLFHNTSLGSLGTPGIFAGEKRTLKSRAGGSGMSVNSLSSRKTETGRVEKGSLSDQKFIDFVGTFEDFWCAFVSMNILPISQKPMEAKDLGVHCTNCGTKNKGNKYKHCPTCGQRF